MLILAVLAALVMIRSEKWISFWQMVAGAAIICQFVGMAYGIIERLL